MKVLRTVYLTLPSPRVAIQACFQVQGLSRGPFSLSLVFCHSATAVLLHGGGGECDHRGKWVAALSFFSASQVTSPEATLE